MIAPFTKADRDEHGRIARAEPVHPVQVRGLHVWNLLLYRNGHAQADRWAA